MIVLVNFAYKQINSNVESIVNIDYFFSSRKALILLKIKLLKYERCIEKI